MDFQVPAPGGVPAGNPAAVAARGADPAIDIPANPAHFFRRIANLPLAPVPGALVPVPSLLQLSFVSGILGPAAATDAQQPVRDLFYFGEGLLPTKFEAILNQLEAEPPGVGLDPAARYAGPAHAASAVLSAVERIAALGAPLNAAYVVGPGDFFAYEPINAAAPAVLIALAQPPTGLTLGMLEGPGTFLVHLGFLSFITFGICLSNSRDQPASPTRRFLLAAQPLAAAAGVAAVQVGAMITAPDLREWLNLTQPAENVAMIRAFGPSLQAREQNVRDRHYLRFGTNDQKESIVAALAVEEPLAGRLVNLSRVFGAAITSVSAVSVLQRLYRAASRSTSALVTDLAALFRLEGMIQESVRSLSSAGAVVATSSDRVARVEEAMGRALSGGAPGAAGTSGTSSSVYSDDLTKALDSASWRATEAALLAELANATPNVLILFELMTQSAVLGARQLALSDKVSSEHTRLMSLSAPLRRAHDKLTDAKGDSIRHEVVARALVSSLVTRLPVTNEEIMFHLVLPPEISKQILRGAFDEIDWIKLLRLCLKVEKRGSKIQEYDKGLFDPLVPPLLLPRLERLSALLGLPSINVAGTIPAPALQPTNFATLATIVNSVAKEYSNVHGVESPFTEGNHAMLVKFKDACFFEAAQVFHRFYGNTNPAGALPVSLCSAVASPAVAALSTLKQSMASQDTTAAQQPILSQLLSEVAAHGGSLMSLLASSRARSPSRTSREASPARAAATPGAQPSGSSRAAASSARSRSPSPNSREPVGAVGSRFHEAVRHSADKESFWYVDDHSTRRSKVYSYAILESLAGKTRTELDFPVIMSKRSSVAARATLCSDPGARGHKHATDYAHMPPFPDFVDQANQLFDEPTDASGSAVGLAKPTRSRSPSRSSQRPSEQAEGRSKSPERGRDGNSLALRAERGRSPGPSRPTGSQSGKGKGKDKSRSRSRSGSRSRSPIHFGEDSRDNPGHQPSDAKARASKSNLKGSSLGAGTASKLFASGSAFVPKAEGASATASSTPQSSHVWAMFAFLFGHVRSMTMRIAGAARPALQLGKHASAAVVRTFLVVICAIPGQPVQFLAPLAANALIGEESSTAEARDAAVAVAKTLLASLPLSPFSDDPMLFPSFEIVPSSDDAHSTVDRVIVLPIYTEQQKPRILPEGTEWMQWAALATATSLVFALVAHAVNRAKTFRATISRDVLDQLLAASTRFRSGARELRFAPLAVEMPTVSASGKSFATRLGESLAADEHLRQELLRIPGSDPVAKQLRAYADRILPADVSEIPPAFQRHGALPSFDAPELFHTPFTVRVQPPATSPLPPVLAQPNPPDDFKPQSLRDLLTDEAQQHLELFYSKMFDWLLLVDELSVFLQRNRVSFRASLMSPDKVAAGQHVLQLLGQDFGLSSAQHAQAAALVDALVAKDVNAAKQSWPSLTRLQALQLVRRATVGDDYDGLDDDDILDQLLATRPEVLALGQSALVPAARGIVWDLRGAVPTPLDFTAPISTHLNLGYIRACKRLHPTYPDKELWDHLLHGVRFKCGNVQQMILQPHLSSLPLGFVNVHKELKRLVGKGFFECFENPPFVPWQTLPMGVAFRKLEPDRPRRTTDGGSPRRGYRAALLTTESGVRYHRSGGSDWLTDSDGARVVPLNVATRWPAEDVARGTLDAFFQSWQTRLRSRPGSPPPFHPLLQHADGRARTPPPPSRPPSPLPRGKRRRFLHGFSGEPTASFSLSSYLSSLGWEAEDADILLDEVRFDFTREESALDFIKRVETGDYFLVWLGPPCNPYSVADDDRPQLFSVNEPWGIEPCPPSWRNYVQKANTITRFVGRVTVAANRSDTHWVVENPAPHDVPGVLGYWEEFSDYGTIWHALDAIEDLRSVSFWEATFPYCAMGAPYQKPTRLRSSLRLLILAFMHLVCVHRRHKKRLRGQAAGVSATKLAASYPSAMIVRAGDAIEAAYLEAASQRHTPVAVEDRSDTGPRRDDSAILRARSRSPGRERGRTIDEFIRDRESTSRAAAIESTLALASSTTTRQGVKEFGGHAELPPPPPVSSEEYEAAVDRERAGKPLPDDFVVLSHAASRGVADARSGAGSSAQLGVKASSQLTVSSVPSPSSLRIGSVVDVDITRTGPTPHFANPFKMGEKGTDRRLRGLAVATYCAWLNARVVRAKHWPTSLPVSRRLSELTGDVVARCLEALFHRHGRSARFHFVCGPRCAGKSCHGNDLVALAAQLLDGSSDPPFPKEIKVTVPESMTDLAVLMHLSFLTGLPLYQICTDVSDFFNQHRLHPSEQPKVGLITLELDLLIKRAGMLRQSSPRLCQVAEGVLGYGLFPASEVSQRHAYWLTFLWLVEMLKRSKSIVEALCEKYPVLRRWRDERKQRLEPPSDSRDPTEAVRLAQSCFWSMSMYTDDSHQKILGCDLTILGLRVWLEITSELNLTMAIVMKQMIGQCVTNQGLRFHSGLGIVYVPSDKLRRCFEGITRIEKGHATLREYHSILGLLQSLLFVVGMRRSATFGMWAPFAGPSFSPEELLVPTPVILDRLRLWRTRLCECSGASFEAGIDKALDGQRRATIPLDAKVVYVLRSDASKEGAVLPGLGGCLGGDGWRYPDDSGLSEEELELPVAVTEFAAFYGEVASYGDEVPEGACVLAEVDALATTDAVIDEAARSELMQLIFFELEQLPQWQAIRERTIIAHCQGYVNVMADAWSRGELHVARQLCRQNNMAFSQRESPQRLRTLMGLLLAAHRRIKRPVVPRRPDIQFTDGDGPVVFGFTQPESYGDASAFTFAGGGPSVPFSPQWSADLFQPQVSTDVSGYSALDFGNTLAAGDFPLRSAPASPSFEQPSWYASGRPAAPATPEKRQRTSGPHPQHLAASIAAMLEADDSPLALRPTSFTLLSMCEHIFDPREATVSRTAKGQQSVWKHWTVWCAENNTNPWRLQRCVTDTDHHRESVLQTGFLPFVEKRQSATPKNGRKAALPSSQAKTLAHIRKMHKDRGFPMVSSHLVQVEIRKLYASYKEKYGVEDLIPKRKQPFTREILLNTILGTPDGYKMGRYKLRWQSRQGRSLTALTKTLASTGFRKAEISVEKAGASCDADCLSRGSLAWYLRGKHYAATQAPAELLRNPQSGDFAILTPGPSKSDPNDMVWGNSPIWLPFSDDELSAFSALAAIELNDGVDGDPRSTALFTGDDGKPLSGSQLDRLLRYFLLRDFPESVVANYSWHSARIWLATALLASNATRAQIQALCRWQTEESLNIYACLGAQQYGTLISNALAVRIDAARAATLANAVPFIDRSDLQRARAAAGPRVAPTADDLDQDVAPDDDADE